MTVNLIGALVIAFLALLCVRLVREGNAEGDGGMGSVLLGLIFGFLAFVVLVILLLRWAYA